MATCRETALSAIAHLGSFHPERSQRNQECSCSTCRLSRNQHWADSHTDQLAVLVKDQGGPMREYALPQIRTAAYTADVISPTHKWRHKHSSRITVVYAPVYSHQKVYIHESAERHEACCHSPGCTPLRQFCHNSHKGCSPRADPSEGPRRKACTYHIAPPRHFPDRSTGR